MAKERVALITAAGRGIGAACARELAGRGYRVALMSPSERSVALAKELGGIGFQGSVLKEADICRVVDAALEKYGRIDGVINNTGWEKWSVEAESAGIGFSWKVEGHLLDIPDEGWHESFELMFMNVVKMARRVTEPMKRQGGGAILNISTPVAIEPTQDYPISSTIRAMLASFTKLYSDAYARYNIRMNSILVGYVSNYQFPPENRLSIPMGRPAPPEEIARACAAFHSDDAAYVTGENIAVDGGIKRSL